MHIIKDIKYFAKITKRTFSVNDIEIRISDFLFSSARTVHSYNLC